MRAPIPRTLPDVLERMVQLQFSSRLTLDEAFFQRIDRLVDLVAKVDRQLPDDSDLRDDPTYRELLARREIDHFSVVTSALPEELSQPSDFSEATIRARIEAGYEDAVRQGSAAPVHRVSVRAPPAATRGRPVGEVVPGPILRCCAGLLPPGFVPGCITGARGALHQTWTSPRCSGSRSSTASPSGPRLPNRW